MEGAISDSIAQVKENEIIFSATQDNLLITGLNCSTVMVALVCAIQGSNLGGRSM